MRLRTSLSHFWWSRKKVSQFFISMSNHIYLAFLAVIIAIIMTMIVAVIVIVMINRYRCYDFIETKRRTYRENVYRKRE